MSGYTLLLKCGIGLLSFPATLLAIIFWRGRWRACALLPILLMVLYGSKVIYDLATDRTSHNLLPFDLTLVYWPTAAYLVALQLLQTYFKRRRRAHDQPVVSEQS